MIIRFKTKESWRNCPHVIYEELDSGRCYYRYRNAEYSNRTRLVAGRVFEGITIINGQYQSESGRNGFRTGTGIEDGLDIFDYDFVEEFIEEE